MDTIWTPYLNKIDSQYDEMVNTLICWSGQNSHTENIEGLNAMLILLKESFASLGGVMKKINLPPRQSIDAHGNIMLTPQGQALQIIKRPESPLKILLAGHMDTVFPITSRFQSARVIENRLCGPGVADMKGGLLIMLKALEVLESAPCCENIGWEVLITPDEEVGSPGSEQVYRHSAKQHQLALLFEPSFPDGQLVCERKGSTNIFARVRGRAAHVGRDFALGRNAIEPLAEWILSVCQLNNPSKGITINVGHVHGGEAFNIIPDQAYAKLNIRVNDAADNGLIQECLQLLTAEINTKEGICLETFTLASRAPKPLDKKTNSLFAHFQRCAKELNFTIDWRSSGGVCDGNILAACGLPTLDTLGAVGGGLHTHDEYIELFSLIQRTKLTALFLLKLASKELSLT